MERGRTEHVFEEVVSYEPCPCGFILYLRQYFSSSSDCHTSALLVDCVGHWPLQAKLKKETSDTRHALVGQIDLH